MGILRNASTDHRLSLGTRCLVGRSQTCQLRISNNRVSSEHASIYYSGGCWKIRDLASRNGTRHNGVPLIQGRPQLLHEGDEILFGGHEDVWVMEDAHSPGPSARSESGRFLGDSRSLWLPSSEEPLACLRVDGGAWVVESEAESRRVLDGATLELGGVTYVLELPAILLETSSSTHHSTHEGADGGTFALELSVSSDEEHVSLKGVTNVTEIDLGARAHNYCLLVLARKQAEDLGAGVRPSEVGWVYPDELGQMLGIDREALNLQIWRARQHLKRSGLDATDLIERRPDSHQLRLGVQARVKTV